MATLAAQLVIAEAELAEIRAAITKIRTRGQASGAGDMNQTRGSLAELFKQRIAAEKTVQRLLAGGRGIIVDLGSQGVSPAEDDET